VPGSDQLVLTEQGGRKWRPTELEENGSAKRIKETPAIDNVAHLGKEDT